MGVKDGDKIIPKLNKVVGAATSAGLPVFFTRDWHPPNHVSFKSRGGIWPRHCVRGTPGAEFDPKLEIPGSAVIISKATQPDFEAYSTFQGTDLEKRLERLGVQEIVLGGLATDYCVKESTLDARKAGFGVVVLQDCVKGVNLHPDDSELSINAMIAKGATMVDSAQVVKSLTKKKRATTASERRVRPETRRLKA